jgi:hypothetical protein
VKHGVPDLVRGWSEAAFPAALNRHLEGIAAIMESHFRFEERRLLTVLETMALSADPRDVLGPLGDRPARGVS